MYNLVLQWEVIKRRQQEDNKKIGKITGDGIGNQTEQERKKEKGSKQGK